MNSKKIVTFDLAIFIHSVLIKPEMLHNGAYEVRLNVKKMAEANGLAVCTG